MLSGWGQYPVHRAEVVTPRTEDDVRASLKRQSVIARGNGRAYGDSAIATQATLHMAQFNHLLDFDPETGVLIAEAGVMLSDIITAFLPRGWFPPVTPGTKFVTLGGMIAADVHGKNHHKDGSFGSFVEWVDVMDQQGAVTRCSREENAALFEWTIGGMGLTGVILRAAVRLRSVQSGWIRQTTQALPNLDAALSAFDAADQATYSVAWIDCLSRGDALGRSIMMLGEHAEHAELSGDAARYPFETPPKRKRTIPFAAPSGTLNRYSVRAFNALYYWKGARGAGVSMVDWDSYFYPLDAILGWNKIYGRKGFVQFQCVVPPNRAREGLKALLEATSTAGAGSFLAVLKQLGSQDSRFSFPMDGYTLALDFPVTPRTLALMNQLDEITLQHGGRFYLAKDSRMSAQTLRQSDPRSEEFAAMRKDNGLSQEFQSKQSERLQL